jgi:hypothetical protein
MEKLQYFERPDWRNQEGPVFHSAIEKFGFAAIGGVLALLSTGCSPKDFEQGVGKFRDMTIAAVNDANRDARARFAAQNEPNYVYRSNAGAGVAASAGTDYGVAAGAGAYHSSYQSHRQKKFNH